MNILRIRDTNRKSSIVVGVLILIAYSILGTNNPDAKVLSMILEITSGLAVIIIALIMYQFLKPSGIKLSQAYLILKSIEGIIMVIGGILFLNHSPSLLEIRDQLYLFHGYIFAIPALIFYFLLYKSMLIPRWLSVWGAIASLILIIVNLLEFAEFIPKLEVLYLPIVLNEIVLAVWLMVKGFDIPAVKKTELNS